MAGRYETARAVLYRALEGVMPGRVWPYPPGRDGAASVAPAVWLETPNGRPDYTPAGSPLWRVEFPVRVVVDGADRAAAAMLDNLRGAVLDAVEASTDCDPVDDSFDPFDIDGAATAQAATFTIGVVVHARTWCPPIPEPAQFPPQPVPVGV